LRAIPLWRLGLVQYNPKESGFSLERGGALLSVFRTKKSEKQGKSPKSPYAQPQNLRILNKKSQKYFN